MSCETWLFTSDHPLATLVFGVMFAIVVSLSLDSTLLHKDSRLASVTLRGAKQFALADDRGVRMEECVALFS